MSTAGDRPASMTAVSHAVLIIFFHTSTALILTDIPGLPHFRGRFSAPLRCAETNLIIRPEVGNGYTSAPLTSMPSNPDT